MPEGALPRGASWRHTREVATEKGCGKVGKWARRCQRGGLILTYPQQKAGLFPAECEKGHRGPHSATLSSRATHACSEGPHPLFLESLHKA